MLTASKLISALTMALAAWACMEVLRPVLPNAHNLLYHIISCCVIGALIGWFHVGRQVTKGALKTAPIAVNATLLLLFLPLFAFSFAEMFRWSLLQRYDGVIEAIIAIVPIGLGFVKLYFSAQLLACAFIGGLLAAVFGRFSHQKWD